MRHDDDLPIAPQRHLLQPANLEPLGVEALREYIAALTAEIARTEAEITRKDATRRAAEAFFRKP